MFASKAKNCFSFCTLFEKENIEKWTKINQLKLKSQTCMSAEVWWEVLEELNRGFTYCPGEAPWHLWEKCIQLRWFLLRWSEISNESNPGWELVSLLCRCRLQVSHSSVSWILPPPPLVYTTIIVMFLYFFLHLTLPALKMTIEWEKLVSK